LVSLDSSADRVASSAVTAFTRINSPAEVSKLQRLVSQSCLTSQWIQQIFHRKTPPSLPLPASASSGFLAPPQEDNGNVFELVWYESCVTLLEMTLTTRWAQLQQQYQHHLLHRATITSAASASASGTSVGSSPPSFADGGRMLWIYIFRQPFLSLVERLMKISCRQIFQTVKHSLLSILTDLSSVSHHQQHQTTATAAQVTLLVDPLTLEMKYRTVEGKKVSSGSSNSDAQFSSTTPPPGSGSGRGGMALEAMASSPELSFRLSTS
jgi:hypothetical protein